MDMTNPDVISPSLILIVRKVIIEKIRTNNSIKKKIIGDIVKDPRLDVISGFMKIMKNIIASNEMAAVKR